MREGVHFLIKSNINYKTGDSMPIDSDMFSNQFWEMHCNTGQKKNCGIVKCAIIGKCQCAIGSG